jgi:hypothetical protein
VQGDLTSAISDFNTVLSHNARFAEALYQRAVCFQLKAKQDLVQAVSLDSSLADAVTNLKVLEQVV